MDADWPGTHRCAVPAEGRAVALLLTGALNPTHRGHIAMMAHARRHLEAAGHTVLAGWLSPSHDSYVQAKYARRGEHAFSAALRREMCRAACASSDWLACAAWESRVQGRWPDFPEVVAALDDHLSARCPQPVTVAYVCGADHLRHIRQGFGHPRRWVVGVPRTAHALPDALGAGVFLTGPEPTTASISATQVRQAMRRGLPLEPLLHPGVIRILQRSVPLS